MNFNKPRSWPHPVLSPLNDDIAPNLFDFNLDVSIGYPNWLFKVDALYGDATIKANVQLKKAEYVLHLECKRTYFRQVFSSLNPSFTATVPGDCLFGWVEASFMIVTKDDIDGYHHPHQHLDYQNTKFAVGIGEPLAVAVSKGFDAFLESDPIFKISSIINIKKGEEDLRVMSVKCEGQRIRIFLPPNEYKSYQDLRTDKTTTTFLVTSVLLPSLLRALQYIKSMDSAELSEFKADHNWCRCLLTRLEAMNIDVLSDPDGEVCFDAAQRLLREPLRRSLESLEELFK